MSPRVRQPESRGDTNLLYVQELPGPARPRRLGLAWRPLVAASGSLGVRHLCVEHWGPRVHLLASGAGHYGPGFVTLTDTDSDRDGRHVSQAQSFRSL